VKRQFDSGAVTHMLEHPSQIRAIPHNSILQQLGVLANTIGGLGQAIAKDPDRFQDLYRTSARFRRLMVEHAFKFTDLYAVRANLDLFDPAFRLQRAETLRDRSVRAEAQCIADHVEHMALFDRLMRIFRVLQRDYMQLASALRAHRRLTRETGDQPIAVDAATRDNLHMLHAGGSR
jgi:phosphoenolpyruvate carboxylase